MMNKRLLLSLYDRSGLGAYMPVDLKGHELEVEEHMEKFAELIVQEMLGLLEQYSRDSFPEDTIDDFDKGYLAGLYTARDAVKKHFGVEE